MKRIRQFALVLLLLGFGAGVFAQGIKSLEFKDQEIKDVLVVLAQLNDVSIISDDTVQGKCSFYFSNMDFETALRLFVDSNNLDFVKKDGIYYVSRIKVDYVRETGRLSVKGSDLPIKSLLGIISAAIGKTILFDPLPAETISISASDLGVEQVLSILLAKFDNYYLDTKDSYYYIRKKDPAGLTRADSSGGLFSMENDLYSIKVDKARFRDLVIELFSKAKKEFVLLLDQDVTLENLNFRGKSLEEMLRLVLLKVGGDFSVTNGVYYIMEVQKRDLQNKFMTTLLLPLQNISIQDLQRLLPPNLSSNSKMKLDEKGNKVVLSGTIEEIRPLVDFIGLVDTERTGNSTLRVDLSYLKADEALPLLPFEFSAFGPVSLPSKSGFIINLPEKKAQKLLDFVKLIDRQDQGTAIRLCYIKADELLANLPPSVSDQFVKKTSDPSIVFFKGSDQLRMRFMRDLSAIDHPKPQLKYQLLVLELEDTDTTSWKAGVTLAKSDASPGAVFGQGQFQGALNFSFDVVTVLGLDLTASLQWQLTKNKARVIADTTLQGISGEKLNFKNTTTIRVKDSEVTTGTSTTTTSVVREISSGLILSIEGWISGNRMITMKLDTTLSKAIAGDSENSLPTTTEKIFSSTVRTEVGKPISVTGLKQQQLIDNVQKVPLLGDIPLLGWLFTNKHKSVANTEYVIYIIPRLELPEVNRDIKERELVEGYYRYLNGAEASGGSP